MWLARHLECCPANVLFLHSLCHLLQNVLDGGLDLSNSLVNSAGHVKGLKNLLDGGDNVINGGWDIKGGEDVLCTC